VRFVVGLGPQEIAVPVSTPVFMLIGRFLEPFEGVSSLQSLALS
jgi:hypothetical protein